MDRFTGTGGAIALMVFLPILVQYLGYTCGQHQCDNFASLQTLARLEPKAIFTTLFPTPSVLSVQLVFGWMVVQWIMHVVIPGYTFLGWPTSIGVRLNYKVNGLACFVITLGGLLTAIYTQYLTPQAVTQLIDEEYLKITNTCVILSFAISLFLYFKGLLFRQGNPSGNIIIDYFYGYEPDPRFFGIITTDVKWFLEGRVLILWNVIGILLAYRQYVAIGHVSNAMVLANLLHFIYVGHYYVVETNVLAMIDFTADHMGWMLTFGNTAFVAFVYTMPEWYLLSHTHDLSWVIFGAILALYGLGYVIFAQANTQKKQFRENPKAPIWGKPPKVIKTSAGRELLISGWWGVARKMNYFGDLIQSLSYALPCLTANPLPYINVIFLTSLLIMREQRDHRWCKAKYGDAWDEYCKAVPYRIVPYIY